MVQYVEACPFLSFSSSVVFCEEDEYLGWKKNGLRSVLKLFSNCRKQELQELKRLQREENRQFQELTLQTQMMREQQEKKFEQEKQVRLSYDLMEFYSRLLKASREQYIGIHGGLNFSGRG